MNSIFEEDAIQIQKVQKDLYKLKNKNILVLGSTGTILSYTSHVLIAISNLLSLNIKLYLQGRNANKLKNTFKDINNKNVILICKEITEVFDGDIVFNFIIHGASPAATKYYVEEPVDTIYPNIFGMYASLEYAKKNRIKILFMSSVAIYGSVEKDMISEDDYGIINPIDERSSYVEAKRMSEQLCAAYGRQYAVDTSVLRVPYTYSPTIDYMNDSRAIPRFFKKILNNEDVELYADNTMLQYTYSGDVASAIIYLLINGKAMPEGVYNASTQKALKMDEILNILVQVSGSKSKIILKTGNYYFNTNKGVNIDFILNKKLRDLGWRESFDFEKGLTQVARYKSILDNGN